jgi:hypothetical protein
MFISILAVLLTLQVPAEGRRVPCQRDTNLLGTWRVISARGEPRPATYPVHKHVTPTHFTVIQWDPAAANTVSRAHGGTYVLGDGTYTETVLYGFGESYQKVAGQEFRVQARCWTSGDQWHVEADIPGLPALRETWVRVSR